MSVEFDHLVVVGETLDEGVEFVRDCLGIEVAGGGQHPDMGTWNRVIRLGPREYLEVIAIDPEAPRPARARWFGLDWFTGPPRLATWVVRSDDLAVELAQVGPVAGRGLPLQRGDFSWVFALHDTGALPFEGAHPSLIVWTGPHPADRMADAGLSLRSLSISHPDPTLGAAVVDGLGVRDARIVVQTGPLSVSATIETPHGMRRLG